ncbi:MAG TPA: LemA family protein [Coleofasciculaceae cyanobacterium]|jgi:LemA protein
MRRLPFIGRKAQSGGAAILVAALVGILVIGGLWVAGGYNGLVQKDTAVEQAASDIDSQMKRRADLVPNLVATVKGYAKHEQAVYRDIANARARLLSADTNTNPQEAARANASFDSALGRLLALAENYPQLKADQNFIRLQDELTGTENRINFARIQYNSAVRDYNTAVRSFPTNMVAGITGFDRKQPFQATEAERATPKVEF